MKLCCCFFFFKKADILTGRSIWEQNSFTVGNIFTVVILICSIVLELNFNSFFRRVQGMCHNFDTIRPIS